MQVDFRRDGCKKKNQQKAGYLGSHGTIVMETIWINIVEDQIPMVYLGVMKVAPTLVIALNVLLATVTQAQKSFNDSIATERNQLVKRSMLTLGGWAVANISTGFILAGSTRDQARYFWRMNGYFNLVNLGLAGVGYLNAVKASQKQYSLSENVQGQAGIEKIYLFNVGLDLAYIGAGSYLYERASSTSISSVDSRNQLKGYSTSVMTQGGFLLLMDGVLFLIHHKHTARLYRKLRQLDTGQ